jgi:hypothetical protein
VDDVIMEFEYDDFAHVPGQRLADHRFQILVHQHQRKPARSQLQPPFGRCAGVGVGDHHDIAQGKCCGVAAQKLHLAVEIRVGGLSANTTTGRAMNICASKAISAAATGASAGGSPACAISGTSAARRM